MGFNKSIAGQLFNYKQSLSEEVINEFENNNIQCNCQDSRFKDDRHGHVITGNFDIIENVCLRNIIKKGPKYRLPQKIDWSKDKDIINDFLEIYMEKWIAKERRKQGGNVELGKTWSMRIEGALKTELDRLKDKFVITVT